MDMGGYKPRIILTIHNIKRGTFSSGEMAERLKAIAC